MTPDQLNAAKMALTAAGPSGVVTADHLAAALAEVARLKREAAYANLERAAAAGMVDRLARRLRVVGGTPLNLPNEVPGNSDAARQFLAAFGLSASGERVGGGS